MTARKVSQKEILQDIRSGMDDTAIRKKYNLSANGVKNLYKQLMEAGVLGQDRKTVLRRLNIARILADVHDGMNQADLMIKYDLSEDLLRQVSKKLLAARGRRTERDGPETLIEESGEFLGTREFVRHEVDFEVSVYETGRPEILGMLRDISEEGVGVSGIEASVGDVKTLVVLGDQFGEFASFEFECSCRWCFVDPQSGGYLTAFAITKMSHTDVQQLRQLLRLVTVAG
jgi:Mor family transcriptional regulator